MAVEQAQVRLSDGTLVRHRTSGYLGRIDGVTGIQGCFTQSGAPMAVVIAKESFQYRILVKGEKMRRIAPLRDLEVLDATTALEVTCFNCQTVFSGATNVNDKPGGLCECGAWICPECLLCEGSEEKGDKEAGESCPKQRKRLLSKIESTKRAKRAKAKSSSLRS
jgi:hypothetical protein